MGEEARGSEPSWDVIRVKRAGRGRDGALPRPAIGRGVRRVEVKGRGREAVAVGWTGSMDRGG